MEYIVGAVAWLLVAGLSAWVAIQKRRASAEGFWLGLLFGPLGAIIEGLLPVGDFVKPAAPAKPLDATGITWRCPECKNECRADPSEAGTTAKCPTCWAKVKVPSPPESAP